MIWILIGVLLMVIYASRNEVAVSHTYNAQFGEEGDHISRFNHGFAITGAKALTKEQSHTNCIVLGPTGSGKSSVVIIPSAASLARGNSSIVYLDISGEIYDRTASFLTRKEYIIKRIFGTGGESFNPLARCKTIADIQKISHLIIINSLGESKGDPFWNRSAEMIISLFGRYLLLYGKPEERTIHRILQLVETFLAKPESVDLLFVKTHDEDILNAYKAMVATPAATRSSVIATVRAALHLWVDESVIKMTSSDTINFAQLRTGKVCLYVTVPLNDISYYKPLLALFFNCLFQELMARVPEKGERSIFTIIDEAATIRLPNLSSIISNIRKYRAGVLLCMQDEQSLVSQYGQAEAHQVKTNCGCQVFLGGQPLHTCKELSQILGRYTIIDEHEKERGTRELMTPDEIRMSDQAIILINNKPPLKCDTVPYYKNMWISLR